MYKKLLLVGLLAVTVTACANKPATQEVKEVKNAATQTNNTTEVKNETKTDDTTKVDEKTQENAQESSDINIVDKTDSAAKINYTDVKLSASDAVKLFREKNPNVKLEQVELKTDNGSYVYEVKGFDGTSIYENKFSPVDGSVIKEFTKSVNTNYKKELSDEYVDKISTFIEHALKDAGSEYGFSEYQLEQDNFPELKIEVKNQNGEDIEYKYDLSTDALLEKDM